MRVSLLPFNAWLYIPMIGANNNNGDKGSLTTGAELMIYLLALRWC